MKNDICMCKCNRGIFVYKNIDYCQLCEKQIRVQPDVNVITSNRLENIDAIAHVDYPSEGNIITIKKGLNVIELSKAIHHEIGHLIDWYISDGYQSEKSETRETNATIIGECIRFRESSKS